MNPGSEEGLIKGTSQGQAAIASQTRCEAIRARGLIMGLKQTGPHPGCRCCRLTSMWGSEEGGINAVTPFHNGAVRG